MIGKKEVIELIKSGFAPESIAFEFGLEIEQVRQCKEEIEQNRFNPTNNRPNPKNNRPNLTGYLEMEKMREKYRQLYLGDNRSKIVQPKPLSQEETELVDTVLATVEDRVKEMEELEKRRKRDIAESIRLELNKIPVNHMTLNQAEKFYKLMCSRDLIGLNMNLTDKIDHFIKKQRFRSLEQLASAIEFELDKSDDLKELERLSGLITADMLRENNAMFGAIISRIYKKKESIRQQMAVNKIKNDIPDTLKSIILDLVKGEIDIQRATEIIDEEAEQRLSSKPQPKFGRATTKEDERKQVFYQISTAIGENAETYPIENPQKTIELMQELFGGRIEQSIRTVVENLITRKKFNEAKSICEEYIEKFTTENLSSRHAPSNNLSSIRSLSNRVRNAEISDIVMTALEKQGTPDEERAYYIFIKRTLEEGNIKPSAISLGKSKDGKRNITLADIWGTERTR